MARRDPQRPERPVNLAFVDLKEDERPLQAKLYDVKPVSSVNLGKRAFPTTEYKRLDLTLTRLFIEDLPDWTKKNEGLLKLQVNTRDPLALGDPPVEASFVAEFLVEEGGFAPTFLYRNIFRNVLFREHVDIRVNLFEVALLLQVVKIPLQAIEFERRKQHEQTAQKLVGPKRSRVQNFQRHKDLIPDPLDLPRIATVGH